MSRPIESILAAHREPASGRRRSGARARGVTLVEVMISLILVGTAALGSLSALLFAYRLSEANLRQLGALAAARAVAEQISTLDFDTLTRGALPNGTLDVDIPSSTTGSLTVDAWNIRTDDIHGTPSKTSDDLVLRIRPEVTQSTASTGFACSQVIVRFSWEENAFFGTRTREDALTVVLSSISSY